jgi:hypothetical protein
VAALSLVGAWAAVHLRPRNIALAALPAIGRWLQAPIGLVILGLIYAQAVWQPFALGQAIDRTRDMRGWDRVEAEVAALAEAHGARWIATGGGDYGLTGELAAYGRFAGSALPVRQLDEPARWDFLPPLDATVVEAPALFVHSGGANEAFPGGFFAEAELVGEARRTQGADEEELERFAVYLVRGPLPGALAVLEQR